MTCITQKFRNLNSEQYRKKSLLHPNLLTLTQLLWYKTFPHAGVYLQRQLNIGVLNHYSCNIWRLLQNYYTLTLTAEVREEQEIDLKEPFTQVSAYL